MEQALLGNNTAGFTPLPGLLPIPLSSSLTSNSSSSFSSSSSSSHRQSFCVSPEGWGPLSANASYLTPCFVDGAIGIVSICAIICGLGAVAYLLRRGIVVDAKLERIWLTRCDTKVTVAAVFGLTVAQTINVALKEPQHFLQDVSFWSLVAVSTSLFVILWAHWLENFCSLCENAVVLTYWIFFVLVYTFKAITLALDPAVGPRSSEFSSHCTAWALGAVELFLEFVVAELLLKPRFEGESGRSPLEVANIFSASMFTWLSPFMTFGYSNIITVKNLLALHPDDTSNTCYHRLEAAWVLEEKNGKKPSIWITLARSYGAELAICGITEFLNNIFWILRPLALQHLIQWVASRTTGDPQPYTQGAFWAFAMFLASFLKTLAFQKNISQTVTVATHVETALKVKLYLKSIKLSGQARSTKSTGDIINVMSVDVAKVSDMVSDAHSVWSLALQIILALVLLYRLLGWAMLAGVALMIVLSPVQGLVVVFYERFQVKYMKAKDNRMRLMGGIIDNMKAIKLYAWDSVYQERLRCVRHDEELKAMQTQSILAGSFNILYSMPPYLIAALSFGINVLIQSKPLTTDIVFASLAVFNMLRSPLYRLPNLVTTMTEGAVSLHRCVEIFTAEELQPDAVSIEAKPASLSGELIAVKDAAFTPGSSESKELISIPDFLCHQNEFCCIIGSVGSGKSSFLSGILGQLYKTKGTVKLSGTVAYVPQTSWIMNGTVKENILFGTAWNSVLYEQTLDACALRPDLKTLPEGDATEVGERGISLSGGQKARISLARAVYSQADIYIIDDCLAAVDEHVGKHLIQQVLGPRGILRNQARILATNSARVLRSADTIYYLEEGKIAEQGTYQKLMSTETETFKLVNTHLKKQESERTTSGTETSLITIEAERSSPATPLSVDTKPDLDVADIKEGLAEVQAAQATTPAAVPEFITDEVLDDAMEATPLLADNRQKETASDTNVEDGSGQLAQGKLEASQKGMVTMAVYKAYTSACGHFQLTAWLCCMIASLAGSLGSGLWIRRWTDKNAKYGGNYQPGQFIAIYTALGLASALSGAATSIVVNAFCRISASKKLHDNMAAAMFRAPLSFFETTPAGQILNRFGSDISKIDGEMIGTFTQALSCLASIMFTLAVVCWTSPFFLILVGPLAYICVVLQQYYVRTSRELSRMDSSTKSPIYSHFQESLGGVNTILAYRKQEIFEKETKTRIDNNLQAYFLSFYSNRWITLRVEFLGSVIVGGVAAFAVAAMATGYPVDPGAVGLALSYALDITTALMYTVKTSSQIENSLIAVERVLEYTATPPEAPLESSPSTAPLPSWPTAGAIEFQHYSTRYRPGLPFVLEDLNLSIPAGARVGIVGRTGAGKSTLALALFRIIEPAEGAIAIDNVDTACIGLNDLRPRLGIILQDPAIFAGTVRDNLDPASVHTDEELWYALAQAQLKAHVESMEGGIHATLHERGSNLSQGQRQLISLARVLLSSARVLVLDEATSAVDHRTDAIVQKTLRGKDFRNKTILTIAHRINTIVDYDYIVVLEQGRAVEFDTPQALVEKGGLFRDLVVEAELLRHFIVG
ncbi:hypothetical protein PWT90_08514 [Aphanocladium album]|nr:hypothetical protein PWT90_08514 [Aphanocladium album]